MLYDKNNQRQQNNINTQKKILSTCLFLYFVYDFNVGWNVYIHIGLTQRNVKIDLVFFLRLAWNCKRVYVMCVLVFACLSCQKPNRKIKWLQKINLTANPNTILYILLVRVCLQFDELWQLSKFFFLLPIRFFYIDATEITKCLTSGHAVDRWLYYVIFFVCFTEKEHTNKKMKKKGTG